MWVVFRANSNYRFEIDALCVSLARFPEISRVSNHMSREQLKMSPPRESKHGAPSIKLFPVRHPSVAVLFFAHIGFASSFFIITRPSNFVHMEDFEYDYGWSMYCVMSRVGKERSVGQECRRATRVLLKSLQFERVFRCMCMPLTPCMFIFVQTARICICM
jgi:hypothetical protein